MQQSKTVVLGVTGGIAAYKAIDLVSYLRKRDINVEVIMTKNAAEFVSPLTFRSISGNDVIFDMFQEPRAWEIQHISLAKKADLLAVVPATANIIGKVANGIADDMLSTTIMATNAPVIFAPAMNTNMYNNVIVQENINKLKTLNYEFIEPAKGRLACGDEGIGKLEDINKIAKVITRKLYQKKELIGKTVLVTAGPTIAPIDPVRYITNRSTGKMGYAIAEEALNRGAHVILISGPTSIDVPYGADLIRVNTNQEMLDAVMSNMHESDIIIKSAAVSDYKPEAYSSQKIKKNSDKLSIDFVIDNDILLQVGSKKRENQILVGFAAESQNVIENARGKLLKKNLDFIVANDISAEDTGFASDDNRVVIIDKETELHVEKMTKLQVAAKIFDVIEKRR
ncbi:bifunctional phosphopantothenoylcysteine decarboxylase/phosphopantothenate--cysteine ligase CoaBC [Clostridium oryzae]|uniref:Coenzyme A biosynthesis bifunctional protein CoaBC n=1 Tax=Clostridium oryzae TaxID=1450648 RepID=A0A1V4IPB7_9CLOT|nr:bifunctional phosphopantothenoylcysteine decarboxylase/phosphopantothenate--cysteine ligase CoaBC [Clostridium oryzae]OPJ61753.1 coenzyme A biosynthesis bifunctional protein CoaBC [Clostridium oryzae]